MSYFWIDPWDWYELLKYNLRGMGDTVWINEIKLFWRGVVMNYRNTIWWGHVTVICIELLKYSLRTFLRGNVVMNDSCCSRYLVMHRLLIQIPVLRSPNNDLNGSWSITVRMSNNTNMTVETPLWSLTTLIHCKSWYLEGLAPLMRINDTDIWHWRWLFLHIHAIRLRGPTQDYHLLIMHDHDACICRIGILQTRSQVQ